MEAGVEGVTLHPPPGKYTLAEIILLEPAT
jgi:hypothetical protein